MFEKLTVGALQTNCYIIGNAEGRDAVVIDPGGEGTRILSRLGKLGLNLAAILLTHAHFDHIMAAWTLKAQLGGKIYLHPGEQEVLLQSIFGLGARFRPEVRPVSPDQVDCRLSGGDRLRFGRIRIEVIDTPGHTPGHVSFYLEEPGMIFSGDTIFAGSIGRTDFPGGSFDALINSVRTRIFPLPDKTIIHPGHGSQTSVGREKASNPFFRPKSR